MVHVNPFFEVPVQRAILSFSHSFLLVYVNTFFEVRVRQLFDLANLVEQIFASARA
jgi:hypothetical protein